MDLLLSSGDGLGTRIPPETNRSRRVRAVPRWPPWTSSEIAKFLAYGPRVPPRQLAVDRHRNNATLLSSWLSSVARPLTDRRSEACIGALISLRGPCTALRFGEVCSYNSTCWSVSLLLALERSRRMWHNGIDLAMSCAVERGHCERWEFCC
ncbi:hypothetical protein FKP32DRAFT_1420399 [Trametes sanguinea]|nr:hypothetical protein FKP32DRAFT_1420399 [Trametes sanguinea]